MWNSLISAKKGGFIGQNWKLHLPDRTRNQWKVYMCDWKQKGWRRTCNCVVTDRCVLKNTKNWHSNTTHIRVSCKIDTSVGNRVVVDMYLFVDFTLYSSLVIQRMQFQCFQVSSFSVKKKRCKLTENVNRSFCSLESKIKRRTDFECHDFSKQNNILSMFSLTIPDNSNIIVILDKVLKSFLDARIAFKLRIQVILGVSSQVIYISCTIPHTLEYLRSQLCTIWFCSMNLQFIKLVVYRKYGMHWTYVEWLQLKN